MLRFAFLVLGSFVAQTACSGTVPTRDRTDRNDIVGAEPGVGSSLGGGGQGGAGPDEANRAGTAGWDGVGTAGTVGQAIPFGPLGTTCSATQACANGLHCFEAGGTDFGTFSPAGGYCSKLCEADSECSAIDPTARCVLLFVGDGVAAAPKICAPSCRFGDDSACGNRPDLACWPLEEISGPAAKRACLPTCNHDDLCPAGTVCDGYVNLCANTAPGGGQPLGSACNPAATNVCAEGMCIELDGGGVCSAYCRRGTFPQCADLAGEDSICGWVFPGDEAAGQADIGFCASTCACDADCVSGTRCVLHSDRAGMTFPGLCTAGASTGIATCPN